MQELTQPQSDELNSKLLSLTQSQKIKWDRTTSLEYNGFSTYLSGVRISAEESNNVDGSYRIIVFEKSTILLNILFYAYRNSGNNDFHKIRNGNISEVEEIYNLLYYGEFFKPPIQPPANIPKIEFQTLMQTLNSMDA